LACPLCKSDQFYIKDPEDSFETFDFEFLEGKLHFQDNDAPSPEVVKKNREIFCNRCAWHGSYDQIA